VSGAPGAVSSAVGSHSFEARAGHHLAPAVMASGRNVYEALGPGFTLLALDADAGAVRAFRETAADLRLPLTVIEAPRQGETARYGARLVLVRPDHFVAWASAAPTFGVDEARRLLHTVTGRPTRDLAGV
jgi:hypothetical protein